MIIKTPQKGRCVFADRPYKQGETVEVCEYITIPNNQIETLKKTVVNDYWFGTDGDRGDALLLLGNGSLYNHSKNPSIVPVMQGDGVMGFIAAKDIEVGDELVFDYGYTPHFVTESNLKVVGVVKGGKKEQPTE